ncbi:MAG: membrane protein insertase YidC [Bifidobacteriaceae bacterium]|jgi:YidC/Oxa1 family membrane protein insertase|nr:membrane protein insertase YidC [Bifidobacteriaceae bacterium]
MWYYDLVKPLMILVGWIMTGVHWVLSLFLDANSGLAWVLSIVGLVVIMRIAMIPLFVRQIHSQRGMQLIQPELQKIQKRYKGKTDPISRQRQQEEMMALYRKQGTNPFSSCLPILVQSPFFLALFAVLTSLTKICNGDEGFGPIGTISQQMACSVQQATLFGAPLTSTFTLAGQAPDGVSPLTVRIVTVVLIVAMSVTTFTTQRQLTMKNIPEAAQDNPMFRAQKMMLYVFPLIFAFSGINFPIGVLVYWLTTNLWTMGQQFFVIRRMPAAGSAAEKQLLERKKAKVGRRGRKRGKGEGEGEEEAESSGTATPGGDGDRSSGQRSQPKKQSRSQRKGKSVQGAAGQGGAGREGPASDKADAEAQGDVGKPDVKPGEGPGSGGAGESKSHKPKSRKRPRSGER